MTLIISIPCSNKHDFYFQAPLNPPAIPLSTQPATFHALFTNVRVLILEIPGNPFNLG